MNPFAQHVKYYAATLATHPMHITEPAYGSNARLDYKMAERRIRIVAFLKSRSRFTAAIATEIGIGGETMLRFLQTMQTDGLVTMQREAQRRCLWSAA